MESLSIDIEISPDGIPYVLGANADNNTTYVYQFANDTWTQLGTNLSANAFDVKLAVGMDGMPVVFSDGVIIKWNGTAWQQVGSDLDGDVMVFNDIIEAGDGSLYTVHFDPPQSATVAYRYDGTTWQSLGVVSDSYTVWNRFQLDEVGNPILIYGADGQNIAYSEATRWDGTSWQQLGGYIEPTSQTYYDHDLAVTPSGDVYAALTIGLSTQELNIYQYVGGQWTMIQENLAGGATAWCNLETDAQGNLMVAFRDESNGGRTTVMKYDGTSWSNMGLAGFTNIAAYQSLALDPNGIPYVAYSDAAEGGKMSVKKFVNLANSIAEMPVAELQARLYPNPNAGTFTLAYTKGERYQVINLSGQIVKAGTLKPHNRGINYHHINCQELQTGLYLLKVIGSEGTEVLRFTKE